MALTVGSYLAPDHVRLVAVLAVVTLTALGWAGVQRSTQLSAVIVVVSLAALLVVVLASFRGGTADAANLQPFPGSDARGILQSAGLLFFAFAGYARIATLGEEVREPARVIPRAIVIALAGAVVVYAVLAVAVLSVLGGSGTAASGAPVADAVGVVAEPWAVGVVRVGAALASAGALLALIAGLGRTGLAMARERDLPGWLDAVHPRFRVPHRAELTVAAVVVVLVLTTDLRGAIGFSSFGVLLYYAVANASAYAQRSAVRRFPRWLQVLGCIGCLLLVATLPWPSVLTGLAVVAVGLALRLLRLTR
jgi:APA family basic amino acid/polyamine antiporter